MAGAISGRQGDHAPFNAGAFWSNALHCNWHDHSDANYNGALPYGDSKLISFAYDLMF